MRFGFLPLSVLGGCVALAAFEATDAIPDRVPSATTTVADTTVLITDATVPARDGIGLHVRIWQADPSGDRRPAILSLTPYTSDDAQEYGDYFARHGYVYVSMDARGRGESEGEFWPMAQDGPDGADVVRWISGRPWSDGRVAMRGGSYRGMVQWQILAALRGDTSALRTVVPTAAAYPGWDFPNPGDIFMSYVTRWLGFVQGNALQSNLFGDDTYWAGRYEVMHREGVPFADLDSLTGIAPRVFQRWLSHPTFDAFWRSMSPDSAVYATMALPILTITGHFDGDQDGAMRYYREHMRWGPPGGAARHYLVIGPWSHSGTRHPQKRLAGLTFADTSAIDIKRLHLDWYDWILRGGSKPTFLADRVVYYVMGAARWRSAPSLETLADTSRSLYLSAPDGDPSDVFHSGRLLAAAPESEDVDRYVYDPRDTADIAALRSMQEDFTSPGAAFMAGPKFVYHSAPLERDVEVSGYLRLEAWIELDAPDTDLRAWVYEVRPDGGTVLLGTSMLRARHRLGPDRAELATPGKAELYRFERFPWFSRQLSRGSRVRLVITPLNSPWWEKNYGSDRPVAEQTAGDARTTTVTLHTGPEHPSRLVLPVRSETRSTS